MKRIVFNCVIWLAVIGVVATVDQPQGPDRVIGTTVAEPGKIATTTDEPTTAKLKRDSGLLTDDNDDLDDLMPTNKDGPPQIESVPSSC